jgi:hypothetical protein
VRRECRFSECRGSLKGCFSKSSIQILRSTPGNTRTDLLVRGASSRDPVTSTTNSLRGHPERLCRDQSLAFGAGVVRKHRAGRTVGVAGLRPHVMITHSYNPSQKTQTTSAAFSCSSDTHPRRIKRRRSTILRTADVGVMVYGKDGHAAMYNGSTKRGLRILFKIKCNPRTRTIIRTRSTDDGSGANE